MFPHLHCKLLWIDASVKLINACSISVFAKSCMCTHTFSALNFFSLLVINKSITTCVSPLTYPSCSLFFTLQGEVESLGKKTGFSERQIHRWFRRRRNQERPNQMKKFKEARYRAIRTGWSHTLINGHKLHHAAYFISFTKSNWLLSVINIIKWMRNMIEQWMVRCAVILQNTQFSLYSREQKHTFSIRW